MNVRTAGEIDISAIEAFVAKSEEASLYHGYRWSSVIEDCFSHRSHYLLCEEPKGTIRGILPLVHMKSRMFGNFTVSVPFFNYGGVCADDGETRNLLIGEAIRISRELGATHLELRQERPLGNGFPVRTAKVSMRRPLPPTADDLWGSFPSKLRSQIRRPQKSGMTVRVGREEELGSFYHVFSECMRDLGSPVLPKGFFRAILERFADSTWICSVYRGREPMAAGFLCAFKDRLEIPWGASLHRFHSLSPNMLMYWGCLEFACNQGYRMFDFGRSTVGEGTYRFKEQWGAVPYPMNWHYWVAGGGPLPEINPANPKYRLAIGIWRKLPVSLTRALGPRIVRNIP
jgi:serine/alanine adding enzyme